MHCSRLMSYNKDLLTYLYCNVVLAAETVLGYYCLVSSHFLLKDYATALKYLDVIKVSV